MSTFAAFRATPHTNAHAGAGSASEAAAGVDAAFLYAENDRLPMHGVRVLQFPAGTSSAIDRPTLCHKIARVAQQMPTLRRRPVDVPGALHHPHWLDVETIDPEAHTSFVELADSAQQANCATVDKLVGNLASQRLPRDRPLWAVTVVTGFADGQVVAIVRMHHALADGRACGALLEALSERQAGVWALPGSRTPALATTLASRWSLIWRALSSRILDGIRFPKLLGQTLRKRWQARQRLRGLMPQAFAGPETFFNTKVSEIRRFTRTSVAVDDIDTLKRRFRVTDSAIVLAIISGALHRLRTRGYTEGPSLICAMPLAGGIDHPSSARERLTGNRVASVFVDLCDDLDDPHQRVDAVTRQTRSAMLRHMLWGPRRLIEWSEYSSRLWHRAIRALLPKIGRPPVNLIVSYVHGPDQPRFVGHHKIEKYWSVGPLIACVGLNITVWRYHDQFAISILTDGAAWTEQRLDELRAALVDEVQSLAS